MLVSLQIKVSNKIQIKGYTFRLNGVGVKMENDEGTIEVPAGVQARLRWWMVGNPGGSMKVELLRGDVVILHDDASDIPQDAGGAVDSFRFTVN